jgi:hypothetical protein
MCDLILTHIQDTSMFDLKSRCLTLNLGVTETKVIKLVGKLFATRIQTGS